jgi:tRNA dimethylallyltransferase
MEPIPNSKLIIPNSYVVCGPTASGKSDLSDALAEGLTELHDCHVPTLVVDSMQVYRELPTITNQARGRAAELVGIVSVTEEWSVARHRSRAEEIIAKEARFVLDAGTGMYLNALLLDFPLAPKVPPGLRRRAEETTVDALNPRRAARERELDLAGADARGSVWQGDLRYDTAVVYLRPDRSELDAAIARRSRKIARDGLGEARALNDMLARGENLSPSVMDSVGVRELTNYLSGTLSIEQAQEIIAVRTRRFARRQMRWFDKLTKTLEGRARITVLRERADLDTLHSMHDIISS